MREDHEPAPPPAVAHRGNDGGVSAGAARLRYFPNRLSD
jgi:hypothetical protein